MKKDVKGHQDRTFLGLPALPCLDFFHLLELVVLTVASTEILKMVKAKNRTKFSEGTKARRDSTSKKGPWGEDKELTLSKSIIKDSDEELAHLDN